MEVPVATIIRTGCVEARNDFAIKLGGVDKDNIRAGVEGLVLGLVEVCNVANLQSGNIASIDGVWRAGDRDAGMAGIYFAEVLCVDEGSELIVRPRIWKGECTLAKKKKLMT